MKLEAKEILLEAEKLTNNDRAEQYGSITESFNLYSEILKTCFGLELKPTEIAKVMMAIKLGRQKFRHKMDNLVDLAGYTKILGVLQEGENETDNESEFVGDKTTQLYQEGISNILEFMNDYKKQRGENKNLPFISITINYNAKSISNFYLKLSKEVKKDNHEIILDIDELYSINLKDKVLKNKTFKLLYIKYRKGNTIIKNEFEL